MWSHWSCFYIPLTSVRLKTAEHWGFLVAIFMANFPEAFSGSSLLAGQKMPSSRLGRFFFIESKGEKMPKILLMVQKSHSQPPFECINPYKWWDFNYQPSTGGNRWISNEPSTVCPPPSFLNQSPEAVAPPKDGAQAFAQIREWCGDGGFMKAERAW